MRRGEPFSPNETSGNSSIPGVARDEAGPSRLPPFVHNSSIESSLHNRILRLEQEDTIFLHENKKGEYWEEVKKTLNDATSQQEYNLLLDSENRYLQIREKRHSCYSLFCKILAKHPALAEYVDPYTLLYFFNEKREILESAHQSWEIEKMDNEELNFLDLVCQDLKRGPDSLYLREILS